MALRSWATGRMELLFIEGEDSGEWEDLCLEGEGQTRGVWFRHVGLRWLSPSGGGGGHCGWMCKCRGVRGRARSGEPLGTQQQRARTEEILAVKWLGLGAFVVVT